VVVRIEAGSVTAAPVSLHKLFQGQIEEPRPRLSETIREFDLSPLEANQIDQRRLARQIRKVEVKIGERLTRNLRDVGSNRRLTQERLDGWRSEDGNQKRGHDPVAFGSKDQERRRRDGRRVRVSEDGDREARAARLHDDVARLEKSLCATWALPNPDRARGIHPSVGAKIARLNHGNLAADFARDA
jgi:hypothetical protein